MTRTGSSKPVPSGHAIGRLRKAKGFDEMAHLGMEFVADIGDPDVIMANVILAAIAYADALTAEYSGQVNQKDHGSIVKLLRDVLGKELPDAQERRLSRLLERKDEMHYGARLGRSDEAARMVAQLDEFANWAKGQLAARGITLAGPDLDATDS